MSRLTATAHPTDAPHRGTRTAAMSGATTTITTTITVTTRPVRPVVFA
ncbi:hypothetical protein [Xanthomonas massiliensis]|nr:hypothetical protein [Xanthomonas massiliensis]